MNTNNTTRTGYIFCTECGTWYVLPAPVTNYIDTGLCGLCELTSLSEKK